MDVPDNTTISIKRCSKGATCVHLEGPDLPATAKYYYRDKNRDDGFRAECKACNSKMLGVTPRPVYDVPEGYRRCGNGNKCLTPGGPVLPAAEEYSFAINPGGMDCIISVKRATQTIPCTGSRIIPIGYGNYRGNRGSETSRLLTRSGGYSAKNILIKSAFESTAAKRASGRYQPRSPMRIGNTPWNTFMVSALTAATRPACLIAI